MIAFESVSSTVSESRPSIDAVFDIQGDSHLKLLPCALNLSKRILLTIITSTKPLQCIMHDLIGTLKIANIKTPDRRVMWSSFQPENWKMFLLIQYLLLFSSFSLWKLSTYRCLWQINQVKISKVSKQCGYIRVCNLVGVCPLKRFWLLWPLMEVTPLLDCQDWT